MPGTVLQDVRLGLRGLRRTPGFTMAAALTLGLTVGAVSTVLTLAYTLFLQPPPAADPETLVEIRATRDHGTRSGPVSYPDYVHLRDGARSLQSLAAHYPTAPLFLTTPDRVGEVNGSVVSANYFPLLGVRPAHGRFFRSDEDQVPDRDRVAVLSDDLWRSWYGGSPEAMGAEVGINGVPFRIIGVAPAGFRGLTSAPSQIYIPTMMLRVGYRWCDDALAADCTMLRMVGRLAAGRDLTAAAAELSTLVPPWWQGAGEGENAGLAVELPRGVSRGEGDERVVRILILVSGVLLLVCCANLAGLLGARGQARAAELAIRASLGASRARLVRQLLTESVLLALLGGGLGVLLSIGMVEAVRSSFFAVDGAGRPLYFDFALRPGVLLVVLALSAAAGLLFGSLPALQAARSGDLGALDRRGSIGPPRRTGRWLLGLQVGLAIALVAAAGMLSLSARRVVAGAGFDSSGVALLRVRPRLLGYAPERAKPFVDEVVRRLQQHPGVETVSTVGTGVALAGFEAKVAARGRTLDTGYIEVGPGYFASVGTPLLRGRDFEAADRVGASPVAIVSLDLARRLWTAGDPIGEAVEVNGRAHEVIGVVGDVDLETREAGPRPYVFTPYAQNEERVDARLVVRTSGDPGAMLPALIREVHGVDPEVPVADAVTLASSLAGRFRPARMGAAFVSYAAGLTLLVSALGLYSALAFRVSRRTREIGVRMAIGARPARILAMVVREAVPPLGLGVAAGLLLTAAASRILGHLLHGAARGDGLLLSAAVALVCAVGFLACLVPARRAARVQPGEALRHD